MQTFQPAVKIPLAAGRSKMPKKSPSSARKPRCPQPFFRTQTQSWYVQLQGGQIPLGRDREEAWAKYNELMASSGHQIGPQPQSGYEFQAGPGSLDQLALR